MAVPDWNQAAPNYGAADVADDLDATRDNLALLFAAIAVHGSPLENGWTFFTTGPLATPTTEGWTHSDGRKIRMTATYSAGLVTKIVYAYDRGLGAGYETIYAHNLTVNGSGQHTGGTTSAS